MKINFRKDFCLWLVQSHKGKVTKIRFSARRAIVFAALGMFVLGSLVYVASDYSRLQLLRSKNFVNFKKVSDERNLLQNRNEDLSSELTTAKSRNEAAVNYQRDVVQRLQVLGEVLNSATNLGVIDEEEFAKIGVPNSADGIGGAEVDCDPINGRCGDGAIPSGDEINSIIGEELDEMSHLDLVAVLDGYLSLIEKIPFALPANGYVSSKWGRRISPFSRRVKMHEGIDFSMGTGSYIYAAADGVVKSVKRNGTYGLMVDVAHGDNQKVVTRYAHLSKALVKVGEAVCRGETIALAGSTGRSTGPHLHYEVRVNDRPQNPMKFFALGKKLELAVK